MADCNQALEFDSKLAPAYNNRGLVWRAKGELDEAMADFSAAIRFQPKLALAYSNRCLTWTQKGDFDQAISDCDRGIQLNPKAAVAYSNRGNALQSKAELDRALADYDTAIRLDPNFVVAYNNRCSIWRLKGDPDKAIEDCSLATRIDPHYARAYNGRGVAWQMKGDSDRAFADYDKAVQADPGLIIALVNRGFEYERRGNIAHARADYEAALRAPASPSDNQALDIARTHLALQSSKPPPPPPQGVDRSKPPSSERLPPETGFAWIGADPLVPAPNKVPVETFKLEPGQPILPTPMPSKNITNGYMVHVSSQRSDADARASYSALQAKYPAVLGNYLPTIIRVDLAEKGIYFRAEVGPFATIDQANQLCSSLKVAGGQCIVEKAEGRDGEPPKPTPPPPRDQGSIVSSGSGFFISADGRALTNAHVVQGCNQLQVRSGEQHGDAQVLVRDEINDLAVLTTDLKPLRIASWRSTIRQGEDVAVYGYPLLGDLASSGNITTGIVTALAGLHDDTRHLQISAPVQPGNSGGPVLDHQGNVVGVVRSKYRALAALKIWGEIPENVNFAIKVSVVLSFLDANRVSHVDVGGGVGQPLSTPDIVDLARAFTVQIECTQ